MASGVFKSVCQDILEPHGVKVGGYRDEIFEKICEEEREKLCCQICYMLAKDAHVCTNKHLFCASCIYAWSLTSDSNTDRCPVCRVSGTYSSDDIITSQLNSMPVRCVRCQWKGQLGDYRCHSHGLEDAGVDLRQAHLPTIRSRNGEVVFPDLCSSLDFERTVEESRRRHQRNYMNTQLAFIEGQNRLAFLLDMFEEDLQRHRDNLTSLVNLQRRYNREQLSEIRRFENELGEVTVTLNNLIEAVNNDVDDVAHRLRRWELPPLTSPVYSISDAINNPTTLQPAPPTSSRSPAEEPRSPVRRARFFRLSSENARLSLNSSVASANDQTAHSSRTNSLATRDRLTNDRVATNQATNNDLATDLLTSDRVTNDPPHSNSPASASNSHSLESGTRTTSREVPSSSTSELSVAQPPGLTLGSSSQSNTHTPSIRNLSTAGPGHLLERRQSCQPDNTLHSSASVMSPTPSPLRTRSQASRPPSRSSATANPFTITWPPATGPSQSGSRRVTRQELRRNAAERSRRDANT